ncbi:MAG TPA: DUF1236 domain-containing protein [Sinorhizobium sp.]|nr:DUF1236 domain-containing protein [Sinorhizobium sp.]
MTGILIKSAIALGLGVACGAAFAQTEQPAQGQSGECPPGMECPQPQEKGKQPDAQGGAAEGEQQPGADQGATEQQSPEGQQPETGATQQQDGEAAPEVQQQDQSGTETEPQPSQGEAEQQPSQEGAEQPAESETQQTQEGQASKQTTDVDVTVEQKTEITQVIREEKVEPIDVDFEVSVGTAVPETVKVKLLPLPPRIVQIVPAYEGYLFFILADGRIVIVEPSTLQIVLIIA